ncbi:MAG TPA: hypothetical protein VH482_01360 [Thermomicrobiales bacterium]
MHFSPSNHTLQIVGSTVTEVTVDHRRRRAAIGLRSAARATDLSRKVSAAQLILQLDDQIARFDDVQEQVRTGYIADVKSWKLSRYMGTLERLKLVMDSTDVPAAEISKLHGFRFETLSETQRVKRRMEKPGWGERLPHERERLVRDQAIRRIMASATAASSARWISMPPILSTSPATQTTARTTTRIQSQSIPVPRSFGPRPTAPPVEERGHQDAAGKAQRDPTKGVIPGRDAASSHRPLEASTPGRRGPPASPPRPPEPGQLDRRQREEGDGGAARQDRDDLVRPPLAGGDHAH